MTESLDEKRQKLIGLREISTTGGGPEKIEKQHEAGKLTARERISKLVDSGSFIEFDRYVTHKSTSFGIDKRKYYGDGVVTGIATISGKQVVVYSQDFTCFGGTLGSANAKKITKIMDLAYENRIPIIGINDSGGARIQEGVESLGGYAEIFFRNERCSGVIPQLSLILGPCAGGAVYSPAMTDFLFMVDNTAYMFITGPDVIKAVTHEEISKEELGGASAHTEKSGVAHFRCPTEEAVFDKVRELLQYIPSSNADPSTPLATTDAPDRTNEQIRETVPSNSKKTYDIKDIILNVIDDAHFLEVQKDFAKNIVIGFASIGGIKIGIVANQPKVLAGALDINASVKAGRFVRFCDAFNIPILTFVDVPGFLPGIVQEHGGIIRHGAKLLYAYAEATVPLITIITRKAYGGAYDVMASKHLHADINLAYPTAEIAVMGAEGAVKIIFRNELNGLNGKEIDKKKDQLVADYEKEFASPYKAAELGYIDEIILPEETRNRVYHYLNLLKNKKTERPVRKHGNIPL